MVRPESNPDAAAHRAAEPATVASDRRAGLGRPLPGQAGAALDRPLPGYAGETCDRCGVAAVVGRKCKVICLNCGTILKSCADL
jgi:hypothetical protein